MLNLSIVIINFRSWSKLDGCLLSIEQQNQKVKKVIVVDNLSDDGVIESFIKKFPWVEWIRNDSNAGFAAACNLGAQNCLSDWLLFLKKLDATPWPVCATIAFLLLLILLLIAKYYDSFVCFVI